MFIYTKLYKTQLYSKWYTKLNNVINRLTLECTYNHMSLENVNTTVCIRKHSARLQKSAQYFHKICKWEMLYFYRLYLLTFYRRRYTWAARYLYDLPFSLRFNTHFQSFAIILLLSIKSTGFYNSHNFTNPDISTFLGII